VITITIAKNTRGEERCWLKSPYHPDLPAKARALGGRWVDAARQWSFDARDVERVRALCRDVYGEDGTEREEDRERYTLRVNVCAISDQNGPSLWFAGREIMRRPGRDAAIRLGPGCVLVSGTLPARGGSANHPRLGIPCGSEHEPVVLEIRDVPLALVETLREHPAVLSCTRQDARTGIA
jgi:hypothetical protein